MPMPDLSARWDRWRPFAVELGCRATCALCYSYFCQQAIRSFATRPSLPVLLLLIAESLTLFLILIARFPRAVNRSPLTTLVVVAASFYFVVIQLSEGTQLLPVFVTSCFQIAGITLQLSAKMSLARSFGLLPANRGIVSTGPYRLVRHPMYLGYFLTHVGFLLARFSLHNVLVYVALYTLQVFRILAEERVLTADSGYREYMARVRYRMLPKVF